MDTSNLRIETKNLIIKGITLDCKENIFSELTLFITKYMYPVPAKEIQETIDFIEKSIKENKAGTNFQVEIINKETGEFLGCGGIHKINTITPELGIWIKKSAHGHGYGKEAIFALKDWADNNLDYDYLVYPVAQDNYASRRIPEALGGKIFREYTGHNAEGVSIELMEYRIYR